MISPSFPYTQSSFDIVSTSTRTATPKLFVWSAADKDGLGRLANAYSAYLSKMSFALSARTEGTYLENLAYTLGSRRSSLAWRSVAVANSVAELRQLEFKLSAPIRPRSLPALGYIFTGQGAQYAEMGKGLHVFSVFQASLVRSEAYIRRLGCTWSLKGMILLLVWSERPRDVVFHVDYYFSIESWPSKISPKQLSQQDLLVSSVYPHRSVLIGI